MEKDNLAKYITIGLLTMGGACLLFDLTLNKNSDNLTSSNGEQAYQDSSDENSTSTVSSDTDKITVTEYLGSLVCAGCGRRCPLSHPKCGIGERQAVATTEEYHEIYG